MDLGTFIAELKKIGNSEISFLKFNEVDMKYDNVEECIYKIDITNSAIVLNLTNETVSKSSYPTSSSLIEMLKGIDNKLSVMVNFLGKSSEVINIEEGGSVNNIKHAIIIFL